MFRILLALSLGLAVQAQTSQSPPSGLLVSTDQLAARMQDPALVLLHVGDRESTFSEGHISGARFLPYGAFAVNGDGDIGSELPPIDELKRVFESVGVSDTSRIVLYGSSPVAAARAFFTLDAIGHPRVALLDGGLTAWRAEGRAIEKGEPAGAETGRFNPRLNAERIADAAFIQQRLATNGLALLDIRPDPEYLGTDSGMGGRHAVGHIAGAQQLPWNTLVQKDGRFLPREELDAKLRGAGATSGKPVVSYCMVGMRASVAYFVARYLGFDARLYDGSIMDWTRRKLPTTTGRETR
ncbi:MAG: sulfurtransferase [Acidobacteria bacterium]|nr:sulfurtransferase [Acidobacteriota bacterium]